MGCFHSTRNVNRITDDRSEDADRNSKGDISVRRTSSKRRSLTQQVENEMGNVKFEGMETLVTIPFFDNLDNKHLKKLSSIFRRRVFKAGEEVITEGKEEVENAFHVIINGQVRIMAAGPEGEEVELALKKKGEWFGDLALTDDRIHTTTARAVDDSTILSIPLRDFQRLVDDNPDLSVSATALGQIPPVRVQLKQIPFFADVPESKLQQLGTMVEFRRCSGGEVICRQGDEADGFYYIVSGRVNVSALGEDESMVHLNTLVAGQWFGEIALLENVQRTATITSSQTCVVMFLPKEKFHRFLRLAPEIRRSGTLERLILKRTANSLKAIPLFSVYRTKQLGPLEQFDETKLGLLGECFKFVQFKTGETVFTEGDEADAFYIIIRGRCSITATGVEEKLVDLGQLSTNDWFGEAALLHASSRRSFTVTCDQDCIMLKLSEQDFAKFLELAPEVTQVFNARLGVRTSHRLRQIPFFKDIKENKPWSKLDLLGNLFVFEEYPAAHVVFHEGDRGDKFYIVVDGQVSVTVQRGASILLDHLKAGDWFGEIALMQDTTRTATVTCDTTTVLISLTADKFSQFLRVAPELAEPFNALVAHRTANTLRCIELFKLVRENKPWSKLELIATMFNYEQLAADQLVYTFGDPADKFYVIIQGRVKITGRSVKDGSLLELGTVGEQGHFGEVALLCETQRETTVTTLAPCVFLVLHKPSFAQFIRIAPELNTYFENIVNQRRKSLSLDSIQLDLNDVAQRMSKQPSIAEASISESQS